MFKYESSYPIVYNNVKNEVVQCYVQQPIIDIDIQFNIVAFGNLILYI